MRGFHRLAGVVLAATFALIVLGAVVRGTGSGLSCPDWPRCYGLWLPTPASLEALGGIDYAYYQVMLEWTHRLIAGVVVGPLVVVLLGWALRLRRDTHAHAQAQALTPLMAAALVLVLVQAGLGGFTVLDGNSPWSVAAHLSTALVFLFVLVPVYLLSDPAGGGGDADRGVPRALIGVTLLAVLATVASGAMMAKSGATLACTSWPLCDGMTLPDFSDPAQHLHFGHRLLALGAAALIVALYMTGRSRRGEAPRFRHDTLEVARAALTAVAVGAFVVLFDAPLWLATVHQAVGVLVFAALAVAFWRPLANRNGPAHA